MVIFDRDILCKQVCYYPQCTWTLITQDVVTGLKFNQGKEQYLVYVTILVYKKGDKHRQGLGV
jgi:hypothetical protein